MATTKITSNVLALNAAQNNINSGAAFNVTVPTTISNSLVANNLVYKDGNTEGVALTIGTNDAQQLNFETNGSNRMIVTSGGSVGVGVTSVQGGFTFEAAGDSKFNNQLYIGTNLRMYGASPIIAGNDLRFTNGNSVEMMRLSQSGNIGINTTNPTSKLHIKSSGVTTSTSAFKIDTTTDTQTLLVRDDGRVFIGNGTSINSTSILNVQGEAFFTSNVVTNSGIFANTFSAPAGSSLRLSTYNQPYVYITNNSLGDPLNFGIGTVTPSEKLTVAGNAYLSGVSGSEVKLLFASRSAQNITQQIYSDSSDQLILGITSAGKRVYIGSSSLTYALGSNFYVDRLSIGTTAINEKLNVSGNINAIGNVTANNLIYNTGDQTVAGVKTFSDNIVGNGISNRLPNQTASTSDSIITKSLLENLTTPSVNNTNVISHFDDFLEPHLFVARTIHGAGGQLAYGQVSTQILPFDTMGIMGMRPGGSLTVPSAAIGVCYINNGSQGNQAFTNLIYKDRKYFSRFHLYGSATRAYYHFLVGTIASNQTPANHFYSGTGNPSSRRYIGIVGCTAGTPLRQNNTSYIVGDIVTLTDSIYRWRCTTAGTTAASEPVFSKVINSTTTDNTVVWSLETYNTNGFWAVLNMGYALTPVDGNSAELIITNIPIQTLVPYRVIYDFYTLATIKRVKVYMQAGSGAMTEIADVLSNLISSSFVNESPYYAVQREQVSNSVIGTNPTTLPWMEVDYLGFTTTISRE